MITLKLKKKEKIIVIVIASVAVFVLFFKFFVLGVVNKSKKINMEIRLAEEKLKKSFGIEKNKKNIEDENKAYAKYLLGPLQEREVVGRFLKEIENITQNTGILVINLTPDNQAVQEKTFKKFKAELKAEANLQQVINFLFRIQESSLLIQLDKISLTPKDEIASTLRIDATISIAVP